jgi:small conductance mechanosensitive channel
MIAAVCAAVILSLSPLAVMAQDAAPAEAPAAEAPAEDAAAPAEEAPAFPAGLDDPSIPLEELELRVLPLTADELGALALAWQQNVRALTEQAVEAQLAARAAEEGSPEAEARAAERQSLLERRGEAFQKYGTVVSSFEAKGGDPAQVTALRTYRAAISLEETQRMTPREMFDSTLEWLVSPEGGIQFGLRVAVVVGAFLGLLIVARIARGWARRLFGRVPDLSKLLQGFLAMVVYWLVLAFGLMVVLAALGVNITPLFALVGGASFILAFAMQDTLGNLAAGLMIMINHPFDEGDYVTVAGVGGTVKKVSVVSTTITTPDNQVIVIPNSKVWGDVITNVTASETRRVDLTFGIGYDDSIEEAQQVLEEVIGGHPKVLPDPAPVIRVNALGASSVDFVARPWVRAADYWEVYWDLTRQVKEAFDARGITIPFPQTEMTIRSKDGGHAAALTGRPGPSSAADHPRDVAAATAQGEEGFHAGGDAEERG